MDVVRQIRVSVPELEKQVKELRESSGKSAQTLATEAGISTAYWYQIEKGERQYITEEVLRGIERALGVDFGVRFDTPTHIPPSLLTSRIPGVPKPNIPGLPDQNLPPSRYTVSGQPKKSEIEKDESDA
ncbi:helix-turn-helix transcriptional regulator [Leptolyngbya sp. FACHB-36]|uniref:helix-turn-helix domain-containing protein n=1 Tax=Leptolyngbya sp. FACHB-36 TaxID=2692808 RepID=UPI001F54EDC8|nr:helix-turn-helix transcriptional regulator [Leptolyngbya sp. FACHB-36]